MKKLILALAVAAVFAAPAIAQTQQVTKIGICDFMRVLTTAYKDTKAVRDYDQARNDYNKEIATITKSIIDLQNQKLDADKAGNKQQSVDLDGKISQQQKYLTDYRTVRGTVLQQQGAMLLNGPVVKEIVDVLTRVSEQGGFALVLRSDGTYGQGILYNVPEVDITDDVITAIVGTHPGAGQ
jgi:outer membrane protein